MIGVVASFIPFLFTPLVEKQAKETEDRIEPRPRPVFKKLSAEAYNLGKQPYLGPRKKKKK